MKTSRLFPGMVVCMLAFCGCASTGSVDAVRRDLDETKTRMQNLAQDINSAREGEKGVKADFAALRKSDADLQANLDSLKADLQATTGKFEDNGLALKKATEEATRAREDAERRIASLEDRIVKIQVALDELNKRTKDLANQTSTLATAAQQAQNQVKPENIETSYQKGLELFKTGDMPGTRTAMTKFIEANPNHELVPNARYWVGETYYNEKNYEQAILEFQEVVKQFPKKEKAPAAMLKQALSFKALKDLKSAQYLLKLLSSDYPKSDEARKAKVLMKEFK